MDQLFVALGLILAGGVLPLLAGQRLRLIQATGAMGIAAGSLLGLLTAAARLRDTTAEQASYTYLQVLSLDFRLDALSAFFLVTIFAICLLAAIYSVQYLHRADQARRTAAHYLCFALLTIAMALVVVADNGLTFLVAWEAMSLSSFFLVMHHHEDPENRRAGYLYFVFSQVGAMFLIAAFALSYAHTGSLAFAALADLPSHLKIWVFVLAFVGLGSKAGVFPLHLWLPHAHPAAPSHISAVMSGVMIKTGIYGVLRLYLLLDSRSLFFGELVLIVGVVSGLLGAVYALGQHDLKRLLAYSTVENVGIILIGLGLGMIGAATDRPVMAVLGFTGGLLHVLNHAIFKSLLFFGAGVVHHRTHSRAIDRLGGLLKSMKITGVTFLIGAVAIAGLPLLNGFVSELLIYLGGFQGLGANRHLLLLSLLAIVGLALIGGLALALFAKVVGVVFQGEPRTPEAEGVTEGGFALLFPLVALAAACVLIGVYPRLFVTMTREVVVAVGLAQAPTSLAPLLALADNLTRMAGLFVGLVLGLLLLRALLYRGKAVTRSGTWGCGFTQPTPRMQYTGSSFARSILELWRGAAPIREDHPPVLGRLPATTHYHSHADDLAERHLGRLVVRPVLFLFDKLRWIQHGDIHLYIGYILLAIVVLMFFL